MYRHVRQISASFLLLSLAVASHAVDVIGGNPASATDITAHLLLNHDINLTGGNYVVRIPQDGSGVTTVKAVDPRLSNSDSPGFSSATNPAINYGGVISGNGTITVQSAFNPNRPAYGQLFTGGALIFSSTLGQTWGIAGVSSGGHSPAALIIDPNVSVEFYFPGELDKQVSGAPSAQAFPADTSIGRNIVNNGFLFSTTANNWGSITGTGVNSFAFFGGDSGTLGSLVDSHYSGEAFDTANGLRIGSNAIFEDRPDGQPTKLVTRGLTVFIPSGKQSILDANYKPSTPVKTVTQDLFHWGLNIQLWGDGIHKFTGLFLPTVASKSYLETAPSLDAVKGVYSYNGGGLAFGRVINLNNRATALMGDGHEIETNQDGVTTNVWLQGNPFNTLLSVGNFVHAYPGRDTQAVAYAYSGTYRVNHNFNASTDGKAGIILGIRNQIWTNLFFLDPTVYNPQATRPNNPILTTTVFFGGLTRIDHNVVLQLGDGTVGNRLPSKTLTFSDGRTAAYPYSDSSGNGMLMTKSNQAMLTNRNGPAGDVQFEIANNGKLVVNNTPGALDATSSGANAGASSEVAAWVMANQLDGITGSGSVEQIGKLPLTLTGVSTYTGGTLVGVGASLLVASSTALGSKDGAAGPTSGRVVVKGVLQAAGATRVINVPGDYVQR